MPNFTAQFIIGPFGLVRCNDASAMRTALGLGSAALSASTAFALVSHGHSASDITSGTVGVLQGGTGRASIGSGSLVLGNGTGAVSLLGPGAANTVLLGQGTAASPIMANLVASGAVTIANVGGDLRVHVPASSGPTRYRHEMRACDLWSVGTNGAGILNLGGGTTSRLVRRFDDTTEQYMYDSMVIPPSVNTSGVATLSAMVMAQSSSTGNVVLTFGERESASGESWDGAYTEYDLPSTALAGETSTQTLVSGTVAMSSLGWAGGDVVRMRWSRDPGASGDAVGNILAEIVYIDIPLS